MVLTPIAKQKSSLALSFYALSFLIAMARRFKTDESALARYEDFLHAPKNRLRIGINHMMTATIDQIIFLIFFQIIFFCFFLEPHHFLELRRELSALSTLYPPFYVKTTK